MSEFISILLFAALAIVSLIGFWLGIASIFSRLTGWTELTHRFRLQEPFNGPVLSLIFARWRYGIVGNIHFFGSNDQGLYLSVLFPFSLVQPRLFIPWEQIRIEPTTGLLFKKNTLLLGEVENVPCTIAYKHVLTLTNWSNGKAIIAEPVLLTNNS